MMQKNGLHIVPVRTRREFLNRAGSGLGALALGYLLGQDGRLPPMAAAATVNPLAPKQPHHPPKATSVIWLFMEGGPSHVDLFDPKPMLEKLAGQPMPDSFGRPITAGGDTLERSASNTLMPSRRTWKRYGQSGIWVSDWYTRIAQHVDDIAVLRSCWSDGISHLPANSQMNTGSLLAGRPALGAWVTYGLGSENENLPTFVILTDAGPYERRSNNRPGSTA